MIDDSQRVATLLMPRRIAGPHQANLEIHVPHVGAELLGREEPVHEHLVGFVEAARFGQRQRQLEADGRRHVCRVRIAGERRRAMRLPFRQSGSTPDQSRRRARCSADRRRAPRERFECLIRLLERNQIGQPEVAVQTGNARVLAARRGPGLECGSTRPPER